MNKVRNTSKVAKVKAQLDWVGFHGLDHIEFSMDIGYHGNLTLVIAIDKLKQEELTDLKRLFGPLKADVEGSYNNYLVGEVKLDDELEIKLMLSQAYTCRKLEPEELTEDKWVDLRNKIKRGEITIQDCEPNSPVRAGE